MGMILFIIAGIWLLWNLQFRQTYITFKYGKAKEISIPTGLSKEELYGLLTEKLKYPEMKEISWDENGNIVFHCKYGEHVLTLDDAQLFVGRDNSHNAKNIEEAEVLGAYIRKMFDVNAPINPYQQYKKMKSHKKKWILIQVGIILVCTVVFVFTTHDAVVSNNISDYSAGMSPVRSFAPYHPYPVLIPSIRGQSPPVN